MESKESKGQIKVSDGVEAAPTPIRKILLVMRDVSDYSSTPGLPETAISPP